MADVSLALRLDAAETIRPGGRIVGTTVATADQACSCEGLTVGLAREVSSRNGVRSRRGPSVKLFDGTLAAGETAFAFELQAPSGPCEHLGEHLSVSWVVEARAALPMGRDVTTQSELSLKPPAEVARRITAEPPPSDPARGEERGSRGGYVLFGAILLACVGAVGYGIHRREIEGILAGLLGCVVMGFFLYVMRLSDKGEAAARRITRRIGQPKLAVEQKLLEGYREAERGSVLECTVTVKESAPRLAVSAVLMVEERAVVVSGGTRTRSETFSRSLHSVRSDLSFVAPGVYRGLLPVPRAGGLPDSLQDGRDGIFWAVEASITESGKSWFRSTRSRLEARSVAAEDASDRRAR